MSKESEIIDKTFAIESLDVNQETKDVLMEGIVKQSKWKSYSTVEDMWEDIVDEES